MKYSIEQQLVDAQPQGRGNDSFVARTMQAIKIEATHETFSSVLRKTSATKKERFIMKLKQLPLSVLVALIVGSILLASGTVYAAIRFAPDLIEILSKTTNQSGRTEYSVPSFSDCTAESRSPRLDKFELKDDAPRLNDAEIKKIVQANCELKWLEDFVNTTWEPRDANGNAITRQSNHEDIVYTRSDTLGTIETVSKKQAVLHPYGASETRTYSALDGKDIEAYIKGQKVPIAQLKHGDVVYSIIREDHASGSTQAHSAPRIIGTVAMVKLSLPLAYYREMQSYLTEVPRCMGNETEFCPRTFPQVDVFPREGGEGARNPQLKPDANAVNREISGKVTALGASSLTLRSKSGNLYTITVPDNAFTDYNEKYAPAYRPMDATLKVGDSLSVRYMQARNADPRTITPDQINTITLQFGSINPKQSIPKKY